MINLFFQNAAAGLLYSDELSLEINSISSLSSLRLVLEISVIRSEPLSAKNSLVYFVIKNDKLSGKVKHQIVTHFESHDRFRFY
ncbi:MULTISPECIES: hypothetical protein [Tenacibaculum]|uniref:hypothetical protein n=1 Tax=Tenacibaculum TaxID=104267 RepID=UPI000894A612|nr:MULTISPECIES: hypothetical protein [unclassified Tenacibaculum]RBW58287.1 hypothetical protein DS884_10545 [Tenacibaculum sp. E3R01]SED52223.1 hypothetical protein SAMN04487765_0246 [Tenacibaculum sp. MAR_2010_89]